MKKQLERLEINLFPESTSESEYNKAKAKYIAEYKKWIDSTRVFHPGSYGLFQSSSSYWTGVEGHYEKDPKMGEVEWNKVYSSGYSTWRNQQMQLTSQGQQNIIDKVNEIIDFMNKKK